MANIPIGQMTWRPEGAEYAGILYLRHHHSEPWRPYTDFPKYVLPDPPEFSEGYATFLALLKEKWQLL
ncbi:MAG: hypothetical protein F6K10_15615 [Moorea sp. SIO2B7]|nr:hypothetical protein [Moorena sp. SIO2B7]